MKTWCYELTTKKHIDHCHCQFDNDEESSHDKHSNQDIFDIILYCFDITTSKRAVGDQTESIPNQEDRCSNKSYVEDPLQIRLDIFSDPLCSIRELVLLWLLILFILVSWIFSSSFARSAIVEAISSGELHRFTRTPCWFPAITAKLPPNTRNTRDKSQIFIFIIIGIKELKEKISIILHYFRFFLWVSL